LTWSIIYVINFESNINSCIKDLGKQNFMSRKCELTGKTVLTGNNVSHSNRKTRRRYLPNLHKVTLMSDVLGSFRMRITANALRSIDVYGGVDSFIVSQADEANG